jgi:RimJ/RimL family protein N-acetyltransferase
MKGTFPITSNKNGSSGKCTRKLRQEGDALQEANQNPPGEKAMDIQKQLFVGRTICLGPIDHENDPQVISQWSNDPEYLRLVYNKPVYPISVGQARKQLEAVEKEMDESKNLFYFTIRAREKNRLLGFASIRWIEWTHGAGWVHLGIGDRQDRRKGYGTQALNLLLEFAFNELNLNRLGAEIAAYNPGARRLYEKAGFIEEVRRRQALSRDGRRWDLSLYGLLHQEWSARNAE